MATGRKSGSGPHKAKTGRVGEVRCHNCFVRFRPAPGARKVPCPSCGWEWIISWSGKLAKIRKPVWESWEQQMAQAQLEVDGQATPSDAGSDKIGGSGQVER